MIDLHRSRHHSPPWIGRDPREAITTLWRPLIAWERGAPVVEYGQATPDHTAVTAAIPVLDLTDFKRDLSELTDRLGNAQDCL